MRNLFLLLLVANLALASWLGLRTPPPQLPLTGNSPGLVPIRLVGERAEPVSTPSTVVASPLTSGRALVAASACRRIGVLPDRAAALKLVAALDKVASATRIEADPERERVGFWVLIPPRSTRESAERTLQQVRQSGIQDVWLFRSGELENAISLGLYARMENAEKRRDAIANRGFRAEIRPRYSDRERQWVRVRLNDPDFDLRPLASGVDGVPGNVAISTEACADDLVASRP